MSLLSMPEIMLFIVDESVLIGALESIVCRLPVCSEEERGDCMRTVLGLAICPLVPAESKAVRGERERDND